MSRRGSTTVLERIFSCLPYLLPLIEGLEFGSFLFRQFPVLAVFLIPLQPLLLLYNGLQSFASLIIFFALFLLVVRNEKINHFIRFNTMQAILLDIVLFICSIGLRLLTPILGFGFAMETLLNTIFLGLVAAIVYAVVQSMLGRYAEIPAISEAVYSQVR